MPFLGSLSMNLSKRISAFSFRLCAVMTEPKAKSGLFGADNFAMLKAKNQEMKHKN
jgi:hypothetical protein